MKKNTLTEGYVAKKIISLSLTMMIGITSMLIFNVIDTIFIGRLGIAPLAAMSFTLPVIMFMGTISMGLSLGVASVISRAIGSEDEGLIKRLTTDSIFLSLGIVIVIVSIAYPFLDEILSLLGAKGDIHSLTKEYMSIWFMGVPFVIIPMVSNSAIRATGNTVIPSIIMLVAVVVNIVLDPLLIFGLGPFPEMGLRGAAIATVLARASTLFIAFYFLNFKFKMLTANIPTLKSLLQSWKKFLYIGVPSAATRAIIPIAIGVITSLVSQYGKEAVAALGVSSRIEILALSPLMALSSVVVPFVGQNSGAGKISRIKEGIQFSWLSSFLFGIIVFILFYFFAANIGLLFNSNSKVVSLVYLYLVIVSLSYGFQGVGMVSSSAFSALDKPLHSAVLSIFKMFVLYIPCAWMGSKLWGLKGIFIGAAFANFTAGIISYIWLKVVLKDLPVKQT